MAGCEYKLVSDDGSTAEMGALLRGTALGLHPLDFLPTEGLGLVAEADLPGDSRDVRLLPVQDGSPPQPTYHILGESNQLGPSAFMLIALQLRFTRAALLPIQIILKAHFLRE